MGARAGVYSASTHACICVYLCCIICKIGLSIDHIACLCVLLVGVGVCLCHSVVSLCVLITSDLLDSDGRLLSFVAVYVHWFSGFCMCLEITKFLFVCSSAIDKLKQRRSFFPKLSRFARKSWLRITTFWPRLHQKWQRDTSISRRNFSPDPYAVCPKFNSPPLPQWIELWL